MFLHFLSWREPQASVQSKFVITHIGHLNSQFYRRCLVTLRIYCGAASKPVNSGTKLFDFTAQCQSIARGLLPFLHCIIYRWLLKLWYLVADLVGVNVSGLTKDFDAVTFAEVVCSIRNWETLCPKPNFRLLEGGREFWYEYIVAMNILKTKKYLVLQFCCGLAIFLHRMTRLYYFVRIHKINLNYTLFLPSVFCENRFITLMTETIISIAVLIYLLFF